MTQEIVEIEVDPETAKILREKGMIEIVKRRKNARISDLKKGLVLSGQSSSDRVAEQAVNEAGNALSAVRRTGRLAQIEQCQLEKITDGMSGLMSGISRIKGLSYLNVAFTAVDLAVDIAGFAVLVKKANEISAQITGQNSRLDDIKKGHNIDIEGEYESVIMLINSMSERMAFGENVELTEMDKLIIQTKCLLSKLYNLVMETDCRVVMDDLQEMINVTLMVYSPLLSIYFKRVYQKRGCLPGNYDQLVSIYDQLISREYKQRIQEYWFLDRGYSNRETVRIIDMQNACVVRSWMIVDDEVRLLKNLDSQRYSEVEQAIFQAAEQEVQTQTVKM